MKILGILCIYAAFMLFASATHMCIIDEGWKAAVRDSALAALVLSGALGGIIVGVYLLK